MNSYRNKNSKKITRQLENVLRDEWIGHQITAIRNEEKFEGLVISESKNMIMIQVGSKILHLPKAETLFSREYMSEQVVVDGKKLVGRPEDRVKKQITKKW